MAVNSAKGLGPPSSMPAPSSPAKAELKSLIVRRRAKRVASKNIVESWFEAAASGALFSSAAVCVCQGRPSSTCGGFVGGW